MALRLALLCSDDAHHRYLTGLLRDRFSVTAVVVEPGHCQRVRRLRQHRWIDYAAFVYHHSRRRLFGLDRYRRRYFPRAVPLEERGAPAVKVRDINGPEVAELLARMAPDVTIVIGTSVLARRTLLAAGKAILNVHGGYLPYYRGNHCIFFAMYEGRLDRVGSTIHFIDPGVDTGDIVERVVPPLYDNDTPERVYCRAEMMAIHRLVELLAALENGQPLPRATQPRTGRTFRMRDRDPRHEIVFWTRWSVARAKSTWRPWSGRSRLDRPGPQP